MTVICNATPLINFAAINRLDILQAVFGQIIIPQAVYDETTGSGFPGSQFVLQAMSDDNPLPCETLRERVYASGWLQVCSVSTIAFNIPAELDNGERGHCFSTRN
ncbi:MAG: hypothetical protein KME30_13720 [Iphinoe sp. HA4291-MV1]|nr:hypothetical protein [Iphinoe sp. HA4291-MV1]